MIWQDYIVTIIMIALSYALLPQIIQGFKQKRSEINIQTSIINVIGLYTLASIYITLGLFFSSSITFITATCWLILFIQKIIYK